MASRQEFIALVFPLWFPLFVVVRCKVLQLITVSFDCVHRYEYLGLQYYGECWSGPNAGETYAKMGVPNNVSTGSERIKPIPFIA